MNVEHVQMFLSPSVETIGMLAMPPDHVLTELIACSSVPIKVEIERDYRTYVVMMADAMCNLHWRPVDLPDPGGNWCVKVTNLDTCNAADGHVTFFTQDMTLQAKNRRLNEDAHRRPVWV